MKTLNLIAMGQFTVEDIGPFLCWLNILPASDRVAVKMKTNPPIQLRKLTPLLRALEQLGFVRKKRDCFSITAAGEAFLRANQQDRRAIFRTILLQEYEVRSLMELLGRSPSGRMPIYLLKIASISESELQALFAWVHNCELFGYDNEKMEIYRFDEKSSAGEVVLLHPQLREPTMISNC